MAASACRREHMPVRAYGYQDPIKLAGCVRTSNRESLIVAILRSPHRFSICARAVDVVRRATVTRSRAAAIMTCRSRVSN